MEKILSKEEYEKDKTAHFLLKYPYEQYRKDRIRHEMRTSVPDVIKGTQTYQAFDPCGKNGCYVSTGDKNFKILTKSWNPFYGIIEQTYIIKGVENGYNAEKMIGYLTSGYIMNDEIISTTEIF